MNQVVKFGVVFLCITTHAIIPKLVFLYSHIEHIYQKTLNA